MDLVGSKGEGDAKVEKDKKRKCCKTGHTIVKGQICESRLQENMEILVELV